VLKTQPQDRRLNQDVLQVRADQRRVEKRMDARVRPFNRFLTFLTGAFSLAIRFIEDYSRRYRHV